MGNRLDSSPPPSNRRSVYMARPGYFVVRGRFPVASADLLRDSPTYQPYAVFNGFRPPMTPHVVTEPFYTYVFDPPAAIPAHYADSDYTSQDYDERSTGRRSKVKKHRRAREKRSRHWDGVEKDGQKLSSDVAGAHNCFISTERMINTETTSILESTTAAQPTSSQVEKEIEQASSSPSRTKENTDSMSQAASTSPDVTQSNSEVAPVRKTSSTPDSVIGEIVIDNSSDVTGDIKQEQPVIEPYEDDQGHAFPRSDAAMEGSAEYPNEQDDIGTIVSIEDTSLFASPNEMNRPHYCIYSPCDVVICHHSADQSVMLKIKRKLENSGVSVAVSYPTGDSGFVDWLMLPQAVVDAKIMVVLLSQSSVRDKHTADEVCLAHVTDTVVYPVTLNKSLDLDSVMNDYLKLQLSCYKWIHLAKGDNPDFAIALMTRSIKEDLVFLEKSGVVDQGGARHGAHVRCSISRLRQSQHKKVKSGSHVTAAKYWRKHYGDETFSVPWDKCYKDLYKNYCNQWKAIIPLTSVLSLRESLKEEIGDVTDNTVHKARFLSFCNSVDVEQDVWERILDLAIEIQSVTNVLDVKSTVRLVAIENIAKFGSQKAMSSLRSLVTDTDPNIRAIAVMSLSRSMVEGDQATVTALLATLNDKNELVRETGNLAFGGLRTRTPIAKLQN